MMDFDSFERTFMTQEWGGPLRLVELKSPPGMPPRLLGDGCGCVREGSREAGWTLRPCERHGREMAK